MHGDRRIAARALATSTGVATIVAVGLGSVAAQPVVETRIFFNDACVVADEPFVLEERQSEVAKIPPFLGGLLMGSARGALVTGIVRSTGQLLQRLGSARNVSSHVTQPAYLYSVQSDVSDKPVWNKTLGCMTIVRAAFEAEGAGCSDEYAPKYLSDDYVLDAPKSWRTTRADGTLKNALRRADVCAASEPQALVEARFEYAEDGTAFRLVPADYVVHSLESARSGESRTLVYTVSLLAPRAVEDPAPVAAVWLSLGNVSAGQELATAPDKAESPWFRMPALAAESRAEYERDLLAHHDTQAHMGALERSVARLDLQVQEIGAREKAASDARVRDALAAERESATIKNELAKAQLAAARREYQDLPLVAKSYMPVMLVATANEVRTDRAALILIGQFLEGSAPVAGQLATKSVDAEIENATFAASRTVYYDLLVEQSLAREGETTAETNRALAAARSDFNAARAQRGLSVVTEN